MRPLLYIAFVLSGAAGLMYESIWSRYLGLFVGHSAYAQIIVLTIFLGGMAIGAIFAGQRSERIANPLFWYAIIEVVVGVLGLAFDGIYHSVTGLAYASIFPAMPPGTPLTIAKWSIAGALILPQSILLGMTFPLMSAGVLRRAGHAPGRVLAMLYFSNSIGAAAGVLIAGFYLLALAGLPGTLVVAAILNMIVALLTLAVLRIFPTPAPALPEYAYSDAPADVEPALEPVPGGRTISRLPAPPPELASLPLRFVWHLLLLVSFGTAVASFIYEIAWIRMLSLVLGSATHSFELMLSAFILGLALGALWAHQYADRFLNPLRALGSVQWLMGFAALATLPLYAASFGWTATLLSSLATEPSGYRLFNVARYALCLVIMLPSTFLAGITLPLITRSLLVAGKGERAIGMVYGINTLGSITGVVLAGLVLMPLIGVKLLLIQGAVIDMAIGVLLLRIAAGAVEPQRRFAYLSAMAMAVLVIYAIVNIPLDRNLLSSGVYRYAAVPDATSREVVFHRDGRTATVTVVRSHPSQQMSIITNGKPDASLDTTWLRPLDPSAPRHTLSGDIATQFLLPLITLAYAPQAQTGAVIGHGSGMSTHSLLGSPHFGQMYTIEIEPEMITGSRIGFYPANARAFDDPRSLFIVDDAKAFFAAERRSYDLILSEPSNPWVSGVAGLFTTEFYARVRDYLSPTGVFGQWLHLYEITDDLVITVLAALHENFPSYEIYSTSAGDILIVASMQRALPEPDWEIFGYPAIAADLRHVVEATPERMHALHLASREELAPLLDRWRPANSDFYPVLDLGAERSRFLRNYARGFAFLSAERFDYLAALTGRRRDFSDESLPLVRAIPQAQARAAGAAIRQRGQPDAVLPPVGSPQRGALHRHDRTMAMLRADEHPSDWRLWLQEITGADEDLHSGTAGVAHEPFFRAVYAALQRHDAPSDISRSVEFLHAISRWDWPAAVGVAPGLIEATLHGADLLPADLLLAGVVTAHLRLGDPAGARRDHDRLLPFSRRPANDVNTRLLDAWIQVAEDARERRMRAGAPAARD
jgi:spermidine synthase